jgi:hypothetical protein
LRISGAPGKGNFTADMRLPILPGREGAPELHQGERGATAPVGDKYLCLQ